MIVYIKPTDDLIQCRDIINAGTIEYFIIHLCQIFLILVLNGELKSHNSSIKSLKKTVRFTCLLNLIFKDNHN